MNRSLGFLNFPHLPQKDRRPFDDHLVDELRQHDHDIIAQLNSQVQSVGSTLASAATIQLNNAIHHVSGSQTIATITPTDGFTGPVWLIADGPWRTTTTGNIASAIQAVPNQSYEFVFDGSVWAPSGSTGSGGGSVAFTIGVGDSPFSATAGIASFVAVTCGAVQDVIVLLPPATGSATEVNVKKLDANPTFVLTKPGNGTDTIDGGLVWPNNIQWAAYTFVDYAPGAWGIF